MEEQKKFYHELKKLAVPIMIQNILATTVSSVDVLMLNVIGQNELSAVSLANQLFFILTLFFSGLTGSTGIIMAQYIGKNDKYKVNQVFLMACKISSIVCIFFSLLAIVIPDRIMGLLTNDEILILEGSKYFRIVGISYSFMGVSQIYLTLLKSMKKVKKSMGISVFTLLANVVLNAVFIFEMFGLPQLGVIGVAIATCVARALELLICIVDLMINRLVVYVKKVDGQLRKDFLKVALPMTLQGLVWGGAMATMSAIIGHLGSDAVAANSIASVIQNIATVASFGLAEVGAILLGNDLGKKEFAKAKRHADWLLRITVLCGIVGCIIMLVMEGPITSLVTLTWEAKRYLSIVYKILSVNVIFAAITYTMLCGVFLAGGETRYGLYIDGIVMWSLVCLGSVATFIWKVDPILVFIILNIDELVKTPFVIRKYYKWDWVKNITREEGICNDRI